MSPGDRKGRGARGGIKNVVLPWVLDPSAPHFWTSPLNVLYYAAKTVLSAWMFFLNLGFLSFSTIDIKNQAKLVKKHKTRRDRLVGAVLLELLAWKFVGAGENGVGPRHFQDGRIEALGKGLGKGIPGLEPLLNHLPPGGLVGY